VTRSGRLLLSILGAFAIATAGVAGAAAAPLEPSANLPAAQAAAPDVAPAAGQVTAAQEPADCAPTASAGKGCDPAGQTGGTLSPNAGWSVTLAASATVVLPGANVTLTATANQDVKPTIYYIVLLNGSTVVGTPCGIGTTCAWTVTSPTPTSVTYTAVIALSNGTSPQATSTGVTVVWTLVPTAPSGVGAVGVHNAAVVSWNAAISPNGPITSYTATAAPGGKTCTWTAGPLTCTISGLIDHTAYTITVTATNASGTGPPSGLAYVTPLAGSTYHTLTPARILDTRNGTGLSGPFTNHVARTFQVVGQGGVPSNATAVTGNLTVTAQTSNGYLFIGPVAMNDPTSSTLNFPVSDDRANGVTVSLGAGGTLSVTFVAPTTGPTAHVLFDVTSYFTTDSSGSTYVPLTPTRILDTRNGTGLSGPLSSHVARALGVIGHGGVPSGAIAVTGNLTVTGQTSPGYLYIGPVPVNNPTSSTLNFPVGDDRANGVTVPIDGPGPGIAGITFVASAGAATANVVFDVTGYFTPGASGATFVALNPTRILDTRNGTGGLSGPFSSHVARGFNVSGVGVISANAMVGNLTVTGQTSNGYLYIGPAPLNNPTSSTLNFPVGDDRANGVVVATGAGGALGITFVAPNPGPTAYAILDVTGYYMP
jgi:hypothetical protein